ncbi:MAG: hypothetical protein M3Q00_01525, partial [Pseudomonadota bacterium]|nr:hypothetical protein [Pseudomonadota bacterium]
KLPRLSLPRTNHMKEAIKKHMREKHALVDTNLLVRLSVRDDAAQVNAIFCVYSRTSVSGVQSI